LRGSRGLRRVLAFYEWLGEIERKRPERVFVRIRGAKDIMVGDVYYYEPWFRDGRVLVCGYLPTQGRPRMDMIHESLTSPGYTIDGFGQDGSEVIVHYRRVEIG
jgi:hypothetical protein